MVAIRVNDMNDVNDYKVVAVPPSLVELLWDSMQEPIKKVVDVSNNEITVEGTKQRLISGRAMAALVLLDTSIEAVFILEVTEFETGLRVLYAPVIGGKDWDLWVDTAMAFTEAVARDLNCTQIRGICSRKGWSKKLDQAVWKDVNLIVKRDLEV